MELDLAAARGGSHCDIHNDPVEKRVLSVINGSKSG